MQRVIELYLRTAAELIGDLETASVKNEPAMLFRASHTLKPYSATVEPYPLHRCEALRAWRALVPCPIERLPLRQSSRIQARRGCFGGFDNRGRVAQPALARISSGSCVRPNEAIRLKKRSLTSRLFLFSGNSSAMAARCLAPMLLRAASANIGLLRRFQASGAPACGHVNRIPMRSTPSPMGFEGGA
jgi:hypothetical protein